MRLKTAAFRAHDPRWSYLPLSGDGAALHGGRFNPKGQSALYLGLSPMTAIKEANQGFALKIEPLLLCSYTVDCEDIEDLTAPAVLDRLGTTPEELACGWMGLAAGGAEPPTWALAKRLIASGVAGVVAPSYAPGAEAADRNLILWSWGSDLPHKIDVHDPSGRLPKDRLSWT